MASQRGAGDAPHLQPLDARLRAAGLGPLPASTWIEVDLDVLEANARLVRGLLPAGTLLAIVVKANGYGHGLEMAARAAVAGGADWLVVGALDEARILRRAGIDGPVLVTYPLPPAALDEAADLGLDVTVGDEASVEAAIRVGAGRAGRAASALGVQLEVDTGMTRGGSPAGTAVVAARSLAAARGVTLRGVWSHLASGEDAAASHAQVERYEALLGELAAAGIDVPLRHVAASESLFRGTCPVYDLVRVGDAFYGGDDTTRPAGGQPLAAAAADLRPALAIKARAVRIVEVPPGTAVGYGGTWRAERPSLVATLTMGYADGWPRAASPGSWALVRGRRVPVIGRVSMDAIGVDATDAAPVGPGDEFVLVGEQGNDRIAAAEAAAARGTIAREVLTTLGWRLPRVYLRGTRPVAISTLPDARIVTVAGS
jgi:alanine racemase